MGLGFRDLGWNFSGLRLRCFGFGAQALGLLGLGAGCNLWFVFWGPWAPQRMVASVVHGMALESNSKDIQRLPAWRHDQPPPTQR